MVADSSFISNFRMFFRTHGGSLRGALFFVLIVMLMRLLLFDNSYVWERYGNLSPAEVGWRQKRLIDVTQKSFRNPVREYLVLGNSQANCLFRDKSSPASPVEVMAFASLAIHEYGFYENEILKRHPRAVILLLTELNLCRWFDKDTALLNLTSLKHWYFLAVHAGKGWEFLARLLFYQLMPELKFSFIPRAFLDRSLGRFKATGEILAPVPQFDSQVKQIQRMNRKNMSLNLEALNDFISFFSQRDIRVIIVEGYYHPKANSAHTAKMKLLFRREMEKIVREHPGTRFIRAEEVKVFTEKDYKDGDAIHIGSEAAKAYRDRLMPLLKMQ